MVLMVQLSTAGFSKHSSDRRKQCILWTSRQQFNNDATLSIPAARKSKWAQVFAIS